MSHAHAPRHGSMQFWPRVRAKRQYARVRSWATTKDAVLGFMGYKVGMTHVMAIDTGKTSQTKGEEIVIPVTVIECPPMKIAGVRLYQKKYLGTQANKDILFKLDKSLSRKIVLPKTTHHFPEMNPADFSDVRLLVYTQPKLSGLAKKKPELFEVALGGEVADKIKFVKEHLDKEILVTSLFKDGDYVDSHSVTKGKGFQGPAKRFGIMLKGHKTEKGVRSVGSLGPWSAQGHILYRVPHAGQMGYHLRTEYNKQIVKISTKPEDVNPKAAFKHYGFVKSTFICIRGSIGGPAKRAIIFTKPVRTKAIRSLPTITSVNK